MQELQDGRCLGVAFLGFVTDLGRDQIPLELACFLSLAWKTEQIQHLTFGASNVISTTT